MHKPSAPPRLSRGRIAASTLALVALTAGGLLPAAAAHADVSPESLHVDAYLTNTKYRGIGVDFRALDVDAVADLETVKLTAYREGAAPVVKTSKSSGAVPGNARLGKTTTAPIVIQQGDYDEAGSSSWVMPDAVWTAETIPTEIKVEMLDGSGAVLLSRTVPAPTSRANGLTLADIMPKAPKFTDPSATFRAQPDYTGITVNVRVDGFTDAEQIIVSVARDGAAPVVKTSKPGLVDIINTGELAKLTAPIVIQRGTYDEVGSGSWNMPGGVWTADTVPTSVTITITRSGGDPISTTLEIEGSIDGVLPEEGAPIELEAPSDNPLDVIIPEGVTGVTVNLGTPTEGVVTTTVDMKATAPGGAQIVIPAGTTVTAPNSASWDGRILLPEVVADVTVPTPADAESVTVGYAIEIGSESTRLELGRAVAIVLPGQAGSSAGFIEPGGVFTEITDVCPSDEPTLTSGECRIDAGDDLVIWTTHFTTFMSYTVNGVTTSEGDGGTSPTGDGDTGAAGDEVTELAATGTDSALLIGAAAMALLLGLALTLAGTARRRGQLPSH